MRLSEVDRESRGVWSSGPTLGDVSLLWNVRYYSFVPGGGTPSPQVLLSSPRISSQCLRLTGCGMALSAESVAVGDSISCASNLRLLTWFGRARRGHQLDRCVLCATSPATSVNAVPRTLSGRWSCPPCQSWKSGGMNLDARSAFVAGDPCSDLSL